MDLWLFVLLLSIIATIQSILSFFGAKIARWKEHVVDIPIKMSKHDVRPETDMKELLRERMFWILELACCFFLLNRKGENYIVCHFQNNIRVDGQPRLAEICTQLDDHYSSPGLGWEGSWRLTFRRKIKEGPGQFLIFQIWGVFGIRLDSGWEMLKF